MSNQTSSNSSYKWIVLLITTVGSFMTPLDGSIVSIALPSIASDLQINFTEVIWIPTSYLLCLSVLLLVFGRLSDIRGRRMPFILGFSIFTVASIFCATSNTGAQMIFFRAIQGLSAALIASTTPAIVTDVFPSKERGKALGINVMAVYIGLSIGPALGGFIVQNLDWRWIFFINLPIGVFVVLLSILKLKESRILDRLKKFDLVGAGIFCVCLTSILLSLTLGPNYGWTNIVIMILFSISLVFFILFTLVERRLGEEAMLDISLFSHNRIFASANLTALLNYISIFGVTFLMSFYLQRVLGFEPAFAGLILLTMPFTMALFSPVSGWLSDKFGSRILSSLGMALICLSLFYLSTLSINSSSLEVIIRLLMLGLGIGIFSSPNTSAVMGSVDRSKLGVAAATLGTMRFVGQSVSLAFMGAFASTSISSTILSDLFAGLEGDVRTIMMETFMEGIHIAFYASGFIAAIGVLVSLVRGKSDHRIIR